jgi:ABC-type lipoprotein export system ATPase subunit
VTQALVECEGLVHIYKTAELEVVALQGLDLNVEAGEMVAIAGRSGSGKTTLMNLLAGGEPPSAGTARVAGHDLARMDNHERDHYRREVVGYLLQHSLANIALDLTVVQNVQVPMLGARTGQRGARARMLLERLGLGGHARMRPAQLTGVEAQRLALAVALANGPRLLLADEPTAELDGANARKLLEDLTGLLREVGTAALIVTHDQQLERHVDRVIQIRDGRTSTERRWLARADGDAEVAEDELVILDRAGRLQLPRAHVEKLGLRDRVRVHLEADSIRITPADERPDARR